MKLRYLPLFVIGLFALGACTRAVGLSSALPPTQPLTVTVPATAAQNTPLVATITPLGAATQISETAAPTLAPTAWPLRLAVFFLWPGEVLNLRAEPGTATEILETLAADERGLLPTGGVQEADGVRWVEIQRADGSSSGWVSADFLTEDVPVEAFCADARLGDLLDRFVLAVRGQDGVALVQLVSPAHGLLIQTNPASEPVHLRDQQEIAGLWISGQEYEWGVQSSSGLPENGRFSEVIQPGLLDVLEGEYGRYCHSLEPGISLGPTASSLRWPDDYVNLNYVALYRPAPAEEEFNWRTWAVGIEYVGGQPYLAALVQYAYEP